MDANAHKAEPDLAPIKFLHRGKGSVISFHRIKEGDFRNVGFVEVEELAGWFPQFRDALLRDSFFSINGFWKRGSRKVQNLQWLNACFVDLDCYGLDLADASRLLLRASEQGIIPPPTAMNRSGRGLWAFWKLQDPKFPDQPQPAYDRWKNRFVLVQRELVRRLQDFAPELKVDPSAIDAARITRVPGSLNTKASPWKKVEWVYLGDANGHPPVYTLNGLVRMLGVQWPRSTRPVRRNLNGEPRMQGRAGGYRGLHQKRLDTFEALRHFRRGFQAGTRNRACLIYATSLRALRLHPNEIHEAVRLLALECRPPLSEKEARLQVEDALKRRLFFQNSTIADWLRISQPEAEFTGWPEAGQELDQVQQTAQSTLLRRARRRALWQVLTRYCYERETRWPAPEGHLLLRVPHLAWPDFPEGSPLIQVGRTVPIDLKVKPPTLDQFREWLRDHAAELGQPSRETLRKDLRSLEAELEEQGWTARELRTLFPRKRRRPKASGLFREDA